MEGWGHGRVNKQFNKQMPEQVLGRKKGLATWCCLCACAGTRQHTAATAQLHTASTAPQLGQQPPAMISPFMYAAAPTADSTGTSRADPTTSPLEQGRRQGSATLQSAGSIPNQSTEDEDDDVFLSPGLPLKPLRK